MDQSLFLHFYNRYDFAVFGFFSDIIGRVFFPPQEGDADIIESFTVFGLAFLARPGEFVVSK